MYLEKKTIKGRPYYYLRKTISKNGRQVTDTISYLGKDWLIAHIKFLLIKFHLIKAKN